MNLPRVPVVPAVVGDWSWLPRFIDLCEACGRRELLAVSGRCPRCDELARAAAKRGGR